MTEDLVRWLGEQLHEDERAARAVRPRPGDETAGEWVAYPHRPSAPMDDPSRDVHLVGCQESDGREWVVAEVGQEERAPAVAKFIAEHDPARVLREIEAKRKLVERYEHAMENRRAHPDDLASAGALLALHGAVKVLALPYADRPGYREDWRP